MEKETHPGKGTPLATHANDLPAKVFEMFVAAMREKRVSETVVERLRITLIDEKTFSEKATPSCALYTHQTTNMIRVESLRILEFRGIRDLTLTFNGKSFAICGPNGTGKSGVVDALEFVLTGPEYPGFQGEGRGDISLS